MAVLPFNLNDPRISKLAGDI